MFGCSLDVFACQHHLINNRPGIEQAVIFPLDFYLMGGEGI